MQEIYYEECSMDLNGEIGKKYYVMFTIFGYTLNVISIILLFVALIGPRLIYDKPWESFLLYLIPIIPFVAGGVFCFRRRNKYAIDYDYYVISGTIRVSKVIAQTKREHIYSFDYREIEKIGRVNSNTYNEYIGRGLLVSYLTSNEEMVTEGKALNYIVASVLGEKKILVFECTDQFIKTILKFTGRMVLEKEILEKR